MLLLAVPTFLFLPLISIDQWHGVNATCPVCKAKLPQNLLRLYFELQAPVVGDASTSNATNVTQEGEQGSAGGGERVQAVSAEITRLQRQVTSSNKV